MPFSRFVKHPISAQARSVGTDKKEYTAHGRAYRKSRQRYVYPSVTQYYNIKWFVGTTLCNCRPTLLVQNRVLLQFKTGKINDLQLYTMYIITFNNSLRTIQLQLRLLQSMFVFISLTVLYYNKTITFPFSISRHRLKSADSGSTRITYTPFYRARTRTRIFREPPIGTPKKPLLPND